MATILFHFTPFITYIDKCPFQKKRFTHMWKFAQTNNFGPIALYIIQRVPYCLATLHSTTHRSLHIAAP